MEQMIYGAGAYGGLIEKIIISKGGEISCFVDRYLDGGIKDGISIISPNDIPDEYPGIIYIAVKNHYFEIYDLLKGKKCRDIRSASDILNINENELPSNLTEREKDAWFQRRSFEMASKIVEASEITFNHIEAVVTERCTLKCRDCSSLMPYYRQPRDLDLSELAKAIKNLISVVSHIGEIRILGGEPFLNNKLDNFIREVVSFEKIGMISIYTNGMAIPDKNIWDVLKENDISIHLSDYGIGADIRNRFIDKANETGLKMHVRKYEYWYKMGDLKSNGLSEAETFEIFKSCIPASCPTIMKGKLYQCPRAAHADNLNILNCHINEYVNLLEPIDDAKKEIIKRISKRMNIISTCSFCLGTKGQTVEAAIQGNENG